MKKYIKIVVLIFITIFTLNVNAQTLNCDTVLKKGAYSDSVKVLQEKLNEKASCGLATDKSFGSLTKACVEKFQRTNNLTVDGIVGPETCTKLNEVNMMQKNITITTKSGLYIRKYATTTSKKIGAYNYGETVGVIATSGNWYKVRYNGEVGYINSAYTSSALNETTTQQEPTIPSDLKVNEYLVTGSTVNVRKSATTSSAIITTVKLGQKVQVTATAGSWYKVVANDATGFIRSDLLTNNHIIVDISDQKVYLYEGKDSKLQASVVTGMKNKHDTPLGTYVLKRSVFEKDRYLDGYNDDGTKYHSHVDYWMPFNGGVGFHDAIWRSNFGGTIYDGNGSHGCVNMKHNDAEALFNSIKTSAIVTVRQ